MGNRGSNCVPAEVYPSEITLAVSKARLFDVCSMLLRINPYTQITAVTPESCNQAYIWVVDTGSSVANMVKSGVLGDVQCMPKNVPKGNVKKFHPNRYLTFFEAKLWHRELAEEGFDILAVSPPGQLGCKHIFFQK